MVGNRDIATPLLWFAQRMNAKLQQNNHKAPWAGSSNEYLIRRLRQELSELEDAIEANLPMDDIIDEAADVANFAMMVADNVRRDGKAG